MIINYQVVTNEVELEAAIAGMDEASQQMMREMFANEPPPQPPEPPPEQVNLNPFKIWRYTQGMPNPMTVDYIAGLTVKLHRKSIIVKGECQREEYYAQCVGDTFSDLIVQEEHVFTRDPLGFAIKRDTTIRWICEDETAWNQTKTWTKFYNNLEKISEGKVRRGNLIDNLQTPVLALVSLALTGVVAASPAVILEGRRFLAAYKTEFENFVAASDKSILSCLNDVENERYITALAFNWIDFNIGGGKTIRSYLTEALTI